MYRFLTARSTAHHSAFGNGLKAGDMMDDDDRAESLDRVITGDSTFRLSPL
ncbi:hypothetical protein [Erwinia amylovora]|uniref:hypothetical protein n=1 Tax=Erwinia amylovora TaxID=552 RepID=UPI0035C733AB